MQHIDNAYEHQYIKEHVIGKSVKFHPSYDITKFISLYISKFRIISVASAIFPSPTINLPIRVIPEYFLSGLKRKF